MDFDPRVATPPTSAYGPASIDFSGFSNLVSDFNRAALQKQEQERNAQLIQQGQQQVQMGQQQLDLSKAFQNGIPRDANGNPDYAAMIGTFAKYGAVDKIWQLSDLAAQQNQRGVSLYGDGAPGAGGGGAPGAGGSAPAPAAPQPAKTAPQGDAGTNTIASMVTDKLGETQQSGATIGTIARTVGVDPNAQLTAGQARRVQGLLAKSAAVTPTAQPASPNARVASGFDDASKLPPSVNATSPAPPPASAAPQQQGAPTGAGTDQGQGQGPQPFGLPVLNPFNGKQISSPTEAANVVRAIEQRADQLRRQGLPESRIKPLMEDRDRIIEAFTPKEVRPGATMITPATGQTLVNNQASRLSPEAIKAAAERYIQTGQFPPNMGRGVQGDATRNAILEQAHDLAIERNIDEAGLPQQWQKFQTQAAGRRVLEARAAGLTLAENEASSLIPRVREASAKVNRTNYPSLNSLILAAKKGTGGTDVIKLGVAMESLIPVYARVLKPVGQVGVADMERAHDILDKAWSDGQVNASLDQMEVELKSARTALDKSLDEFGMRPKKGEAGKSDDAGSAAGAATSFKPPGDWQYSPSRGQYRDPSGKVYDLNGKPVN